MGLANNLPYFFFFYFHRSEEQRTRRSDYEKKMLCLRSQSKDIPMLIYNTTYHVEEDQEKYFLIWLQEYYLPEIEKNGVLHTPRILRVLSHREEGACFSVQFEVEDSACLHRWHREQGTKLNEELLKIFKDKVVGFPTLMEIIV